MEGGVLAPVSDARAVLELITCSYLNLMLFAVPLGWAAHIWHGGPVLVFTLNFIGLIPLALVLGNVTEDLADRFGDTIGGLINATFGNVVEMMLTYAALRNGLYDVVSMSLVGSILSNMLLVLGFCYLVGGMKFQEQRFSTLANKAYCSMLFLACIALLVPTCAAAFYGPSRFSDDAVLTVSRATAILLACAYAAYLVFTLGTHSEPIAAEAQRSAAAVAARSVGRADAEAGAGAPLLAGLDCEEEDGEGGPRLSLVAAIIALAGITVLVAVASELLTGTIEEVASRTGMTKLFLGLVVLPIAGNACEHISAVIVAAKGKMDLAQSIALGSSLQIAVCVLPFAVLVAWAMGRPYTLVLDPFAATMLFLAVAHEYTTSADGASNWLLGVQLIGVYVLIALPYLFLAD